MPNTYKKYALAQSVAVREAMGQLGGSENLEDDVALCAIQTIEPALIRYLPKEGKVLESGCGRGRWVFYLRRKGYDVVGIDLAKFNIEFAKRHDPSVPIFCDDVLRTRFPDQSFAAVISLGVVEHFEEGPQAAFAEVVRLLQPGGFFFVAVPTQNLARVFVFNHIKSLQNQARKLRGSKLVFEEYRYSRKEFGALLCERGFEILDTVADDFLPPRNIGLYTDLRFLQNKGQGWQLNAAGRWINRIARFISPWLVCSGTLWVCRKQVAHKQLADEVTKVPLSKGNFGVTH